VSMPGSPPGSLPCNGARAAPAADETATAVEHVVAPSVAPAGAETGALKRKRDAETHFFVRLLGEAALRAKREQRTGTD